MTFAKAALAYVVMSATLVSCGRSDEDALDQINERLSAMEERYGPSPGTFEHNLRSLEDIAEKRESYYARVREQTETHQKREYLIDTLKEEALSYVKKETIDHVEHTSRQTFSDFKEWSRRSFDRLTNLMGEQ